MRTLTRVLVTAAIAAAPVAGLATFAGTASASTDTTASNTEYCFYDRVYDRLICIEG
jgi:hypothetical protein